MFEDLFNKHDWDTVKERIYNSTEDDVIHALESDQISPDRIYPLLSPAADSYIENMARQAYTITRQRFGNTIQLYTPLYLSNECTNTCAYCGFNRNNDIRRITLSPEQALEEAEIIYNMGFRHILLLTGEDKRAVPVSYLSEIGKQLHKKFASLSIEIYPMETEEYRLLSESGIDGLTLYQETYNKEIYSKMHQKGKKRDFSWRLAGPDRGGKAGLRKIGIGALLGLSDWRVEGFFTALHAIYLTKTYWKSHILISFPRLREALGDFAPPEIVNDRNLTQLICAIRNILPDAGLVISTRESEYFRDNVLPLGITMMSAGSRTEPGGYSEMEAADKQFEICDSRSPYEIAEMIKTKGFDPVWKDWDRDFIA